MKALLSAIKTKLQTELTYVRNNDVFVTEDENLLPKSAKSHAVGIKDGAVTHKELAGGMLELTMTVKIVLWVQLAKPEAAIMGDDAADKKGVLDMEADVHGVLDENLLAIAGMQSAVRSPISPGSELFGDETDAMIRKVITYEYTKEKERP